MGRFSKIALLIIILTGTVFPRPAQAWINFYFNGPRGYISFWSPYRSWFRYGVSWNPALSSVPSYSQMQNHRKAMEGLVEQKIVTYHKQLDENSIREKEKILLQKQQQDFEKFEHSTESEIKYQPKPKEVITTDNGKVVVNYF